MDKKFTDTVSIPIETNKKHIRQIDKTFNVKASKVTTETYLVADVVLEDYLNPYINKAKRGYIWNVKTAPASTVFIKPVKLCKEDEMGHNGRGLADLTPLFTVECTLYFKQTRMTQMIDAVAFLNFIASGEYTEVKPIRIKPEVSNMIIDDPLKPSMDLAVDKYGELKMASPAETDDAFNDMLKKSLGQSGGSLRHQIGLAEMAVKEMHSAACKEYREKGFKVSEMGDEILVEANPKPCSPEENKILSNIMNQTPDFVGGTWLMPTNKRIQQLEKDKQNLIDELVNSRQQVRDLGGVPK